MRIFDLLSTCFSNLFKRKMRTLLTLLGVVLGSSSVALTFALGEAVKENNQAILESTGFLKKIQVNSDEYYGEANSDKDKKYIDDELIKKIENMDGVDYVNYSLDVSTREIRLCSGKRDRYVDYYLCGINMKNAEKYGYILKNGMKIQKDWFKFNSKSDTIKVIGGQYFEYFFQDLNQKDYDKAYRYNNNVASKYYNEKWGGEANRSKMLPPFFNADKEDVYLTIFYPNENSQSLLENDLNYNEFKDNNDDSDEWKKKTYKIDLIGRMDWDKLKQTENGWQAAFGMFLDIDNLKDIFRESRKLNNVKEQDPNKPEFTYNYLVVETTSIDKVLDITKKIKNMGYSAYNLLEEINIEKERAASLQFILGILGGLTLFVSALSIANTMITSVYERTKEIGIIKVLGCKIGNIQIMFLIESAIIGLFGGILGMGVAYGFCNFMNKIVAGNAENLSVFGKVISEFVEGMKGNLDGFGEEVVMKMAIIKPSLCVMVILGSMLIGTIAGYIPSMRASKISALKAIKDE